MFGYKGFVMKNHERRQINAFPYYKLAVWSERNCCWNDGKRVYETKMAAIQEAASVGGGKYRLSTITDAGRIDGVPFII